MQARVTKSHYSAPNEPPIFNQIVNPLKRGLKIEIHFPWSRESTVDVFNSWETLKPIEENTKNERIPTFIQNIINISTDELLVPHNGYK